MRPRKRYWNAWYSSDSDFTTSYSEGEQSRGALDADYELMMHPVDPVTGWVNGELSRLSDPMLTNSERASIINRLQKMDGSYLPSGLTDNEVFDLIPTRYFSDPVDIQKWRDYLASDVIPYMSEDKQDKLNGESDDKSSGADSDNASGNDNSNSDVDSGS